MTSVLCSPCMSQRGFRCTRVQLLYLHSSWAHEAPPVPIQAKDEGIGQTVERRRQDMQQGEREGWILWVECIMEPVGRREGGRERERQRC